MIFLVIFIIGGLSLFVSGFVLLFSACPEVAFTRSGGGRTILLGFTCYDETPLGIDSIPGWVGALLLIFGGIAVATFPFWAAPIFMLAERVRDWFSTPPSRAQAHRSGMASADAALDFAAREHARDDYEENLRRWASEAYRETYLEGFLQQGQELRQTNPDRVILLRELNDLHNRNMTVAEESVHVRVDPDVLIRNGIFPNTILPGSNDRADLLQEAIDQLNEIGIPLVLGERTGITFATAWRGSMLGMEKNFLQFMEDADARIENTP